MRRPWLLSACSALTLLAMAAATFRPGDRQLYPPPPGSPGAVTVYASYNGFHSDLVVPESFLLEGHGPSAMAVAELAPRRWAVVGWGDAAFYQGDGLNVARILTLLHSGLWPFNPAVVHVASDDDPLRPSPGWRALRLTLSASGAEGLRRRLDDSFALTAGRPTPTRPLTAGAPPPEDRFFKSRENAWIGHVCNHWTAQLLNAAGASIAPLLDLTTTGLQADLLWNAKATPALR